MEPEQVIDNISLRQNLKTDITHHQNMQQSLGLKKKKRCNKKESLRWKRNNLYMYKQAGLHIMKNFHLPVYNFLGEDFAETHLPNCLVSLALGCRAITGIY